MNRTVWIDGAKVTLDAAALLGQGGEAEVYDLGDGRVCKWWKPPDHPDFDGLPDAQATAQRRLLEQPAKLRALPGRLPPAVVAPSGLALVGKRSTAVAGYVMPKVAGVPLHAFGEPKWRRDHPVPGADVVAALLALQDAIAALHACGVVIGDCNDLNVLVDGTRVHLIDVDSYQFAGFTCAMFSERFVDPRLCDATQLVPVRPHDADSDWFAFAVMAFRSLLCVGPWGGVYQPADPSARCVAAQRALRRLSVYAPDVVNPRAARSLAILPDDLTDEFRAIFERDRRGPFPRDLLARLRLRACSACGEEHARARCPACQAAAVFPPVVVTGRLRWKVIDPRDVARPAYEVARAETAPTWARGPGASNGGLRTRSAPPGHAAASTWTRAFAIGRAARPGAVKAHAARTTPPQTGAAKIAKIAKPRFLGSPAREVSANAVNAFPRVLLGDLGDLGGSPSEGDDYPNSIAAKASGSGSVPSSPRVWRAGGALWRAGRLGPERIGNILAGQTRAWVGDKLGVGFYRAGGYAVGFVFRPDRGPLDDRVALPKIRGRLVDAHATIGDDRAWLWLTCEENGRIATTCVVIGADASVLAAGVVDAPWAAGVAGACAAGPHLFVPTDDGIVRVELVHGAIAQTRSFPETAPLVGAADRLALGAGGLDVVRRRDALRLHLS